MSNNRRAQELAGIITEGKSAAYKTHEAAAKQIEKSIKAIAKKVDGGKLDFETLEMLAGWFDSILEDVENLSNELQSQVESNDDFMNY